MALASIGDLNGSPEEVSMRIRQAKTLSSMYDDFLDLEQEVPDDGSRQPGIHASELYPCLRKPFYSLSRVEPQKRISKFWLQRFKVGHAIHGLLQHDFKRMAKRSQLRQMMRFASKSAEELDLDLFFEDEVTIAPDKQALAKHYQIFSSCDGVFTFADRQNGEPLLRIGLEIKTESPDEYAKLKEPKPEHLRQGHLYMACLDLPLMWFFYTNKGNQNNTNSEAPFLVVWNPLIWQEVEGRMQIIHDHVQRGEPPERNEGIFCEFCPWSYTCQPSNINTGPKPRPPSRKELIRGSDNR